MSEAFIKYTALLCLLHHEMKSGRDEGNDSPADAIREQMDEPWYAMSAEEQDLTNKISALVYELDKPLVV